MDPNHHIEDTIKVLAGLVKEGKIGAIGLSEVKADTIYRAQKVHPIASVEVEVSLWAMDIFSNGVAKACAEWEAQESRGSAPRRLAKIFATFYAWRV